MIGRTANSDGPEELIERAFAHVDAATADIPPMDASQIAYAKRVVGHVIASLEADKRELVEALRFIKRHIWTGAPEADKERINAVLAKHEGAR